MLLVGKEYRVWSLRESMGPREGVVVEVDWPMFVLDDQGVKTLFHMATVACVEIVDEAAEEARRKANTAKQIAAWT